MKGRGIDEEGRADSNRGEDGDEVAANGGDVEADGLRSGDEREVGEDLDLLAEGGIERGGRLERVDVGGATHGEGDGRGANGESGSGTNEGGIAEEAGGSRGVADEEGVGELGASDDREGVVEGVGDADGGGARKLGELDEDVATDDAKR